jgi:hypothetical protein
MRCKMSPALYETAGSLVVLYIYLIYLTRN